MNNVYLAGPILGCTKGDANNWRYAVASALKPHGIVGISPLRCEPLIGERYAPTYSDPKFGTEKAIGSKNLFDVQVCDMILAYLPKPDEPEPTWTQSYGTLAEIAWGKALQKPVIVVTNDQKVATHPVIGFCANWMLSDMGAALDVVVGILGGYNGGKHV